jgi:hypothetical protein
MRLPEAAPKDAEIVIAAPSPGTEIVVPVAAEVAEVVAAGAALAAMVPVVLLAALGEARPNRTPF